MRLCVFGQGLPITSHEEDPERLACAHWRAALLALRATGNTKGKKSKRYIFFADFGCRGSPRMCRAASHLRSCLLRLEQ
jgi:hypothetical protein